MPATETLISFSNSLHGSGRNERNRNDDDRLPSTFEESGTASSTGSGASLSSNRAPMPVDRFRGRLNDLRRMVAQSIASDPTSTSYLRSERSRSSQPPAVIEIFDSDDDDNGDGIEVVGYLP